MRKKRKHARRKKRGSEAKNQGRKDVKDEDSKG